MSRRSQDTAYLLQMAFPMGDKPVEFFDANPSLKRLMGPDFERNPWMGPHGPTITGSGTIMMRRKMDIPDSIQVRHLAGVEVMQMSGWDVSQFISTSIADLPTSTLLSNLAGNAFSAFACLPLIFSVLLVVEAGAQMQTRSAIVLRMVVPGSESEDESADEGSCGSSREGANRVATA